MNDFEDAEQKLTRAEGLDPSNNTGVLTRAELLWNTGRQHDAADYLMSSLPKLPLDMKAREKLLEWLRESGRTDEWQEVTAETLRILKAFPETV